MLLGTFINGYKSYDRAYYMPITDGVKEKYSSYIGNNGVGKSAILESLDVFFNNRSWNINRGATRDEIYISPVFLIEKAVFIERLKNEEYYNSTEREENEVIINDLDKISQFIWNRSDSSFQGAARREHIKEFLDLINCLKQTNCDNDYFLVVIGVNYSGKVTLSPLHSYIRSEFSDSDFEKKIDKIRKVILDYYAYVYIPVEQSVDEVLNIETRQMQTLMNRDVLKAVDGALTSKIEIFEGRQKTLTLLSFINEHLNAFMKEINDSIQSIDQRYNYGAELFSRKNLTASDIREKILEAYFSKRSLRHNNREIYQLSSGEQRRSLIDIAFAFLSNRSGQSDKHIILAIDEPEVSLNIANCFSQFERLEKLTYMYGAQILITTHWYGFLPITKRGYLYHLSKDDSEALDIIKFSFFNYLDERRRFPDDVELKSMFDLVTSILSYMKVYSNSKWIICEGSDDKIYLDCLLSTEIVDLRILPVGGCGNVSKLFSLLSMPLNLEKGEKKSISGKVLCLIDTDEIKMNYVGAAKAEAIQLKRLQISKERDSFNINLITPDIQGHCYSQTEIEDCLVPEIYYNAISKVIMDSNNEEIKEIFSKFAFDSAAQVSRIAGDESILIPQEAQAYKLKGKIGDFLSQTENKYKVAKEYTSLYKEFEGECKLSKVIVDFFLNECH
ncbi:AAA family ATPase [Anaerospora hongkongensis]|uniref:AAA family ATPase n=1 Tax=Anaerospora hongkongensis TaxID=244830 RepID=UPI00289F22CC|nr:AAA family ATPase [Anaerospora hongkongensis]